MINRIVISGYRCFKHLDLEPNPGLNIVVGDNECGKSTLLEAIALGLTGRINGRWAVEELNPFWFHRQAVLDFFAAYARNEPIEPPTICIELYFVDDIDAVQRFRGVHNSQQGDCPGVALSVSPAEDYRAELDEYLASTPPAILPVEYYEVNWHSFADQRLAKRPRELATSYIDSRTIRSTAGVDYHTREMLSEHLDGQERAAISLAHRRSRQTITENTLGAINERIGRDSKELHHKPIGLQMDQSSRSSWEAGVVPQVEDIPFAMSGQGQQSAIKMSLAMSRTSGASTFVLIEEPENHLSHTSLNRLISRIATLAGADQQLFICTHSSYVANRLGLDKLILLNQGATAKLSSLPADTVSYFRKLAGYDTLRLVLANHVVLVEGPSDVIIFERAYRDAVGNLPMELGVDVISMGGLTSRRALEVCRALKRRATTLQDNDGRTPEEISDALGDLLDGGERKLFVGNPNDGNTLEPQLLSANTSDSLRKVLDLKDSVELLNWMSNNKTEMAIRIFDSEQLISMPTYIQEAIAFLRQHT